MKEIKESPFTKKDLNTKKNLQFLESEEDKQRKNDLITFKSLK